MVLLDTCSLIWIAIKHEELSPAALALLRSNPNQVYISSISAIDLAMAVRKGRLSLGLEVEEWFFQQTAGRGIQEVDVTSTIGFRAAKLPLIHRDPFDRIIIATAQEQEWILISKDLEIRKYPDLKIIW